MSAGLAEMKHTDNQNMYMCRIRRQQTLRNGIRTRFHKREVLSRGILRGQRHGKIQARPASANVWGAIVRVNDIAVVPECVAVFDAVS